MSNLQRALVEALRGRVFPRRTDVPRYHYTAEALTEASEAWGCNCGPGSLAMMLCLNPHEIRSSLPDFPSRRYTNVTMMKTALQILGVNHHAGPRGFSRYGLCRIQWGGPWCEGGSGPLELTKVGKWGYRFSHWIGCMKEGSELRVFDINAGWLTHRVWEKTIVPQLTALYERSNGLYYVTNNIELDLPIPSPGTCAICRCTEMDCRHCLAKTGEPCAWVDSSRTLCSACLPDHPGLRPFPAEAVFRNA